MDEAEAQAVLAEGLWAESSVVDEGCGCVVQVVVGLTLLEFWRVGAVDHLEQLLLVGDEDCAEDAVVVDYL